jgi:hypothetical protein
MKTKNQLITNTSKRHFVLLMLTLLINKNTVLAIIAEAEEVARAKQHLEWLQEQSPNNF